MQQGVKLMNNVLFHAPDTASEETKNVSRNLILKSIVGREMTNFREFSNINNQLNSNIDATMKIADKMYNIALKLSWATSSLATLIYNGFLPRNKGNIASEAVEAASREWETAYNKGELL